MENLSPVTLTTCLKASGVIGTSIFIVELIARKKNIKWRPSYCIAVSAKNMRRFFSAVGEKIAWISSYLKLVKKIFNWINLHELADTAIAIGKPTFELITSPMYTFSGYIKAAMRYGETSWMVYMGSLMMIGVLGSTIYYSQTNPNMKLWITSNYTKFIDRNNK